MSNHIGRALWWALVVSLFINLLVAHLAPLPVDPRAPIELLAPLFAAMTVAIAVGTAAYRRRALAGPIQSGQLDPRTPTGFQQAFRPCIINLLPSESVGIGFPLGVLPCGGSVIPTFLSYMTEKRLSDTPERFGKGAIEGVAGPEAANNAAAAGVLVPLLTLGLPSSATAAVLLAAFQQYGLLMRD